MSKTVSFDLVKKVAAANAKSRYYNSFSMSTKIGMVDGAKPGYDFFNNRLL